MNPFLRFLILALLLSPLSLMAQSPVGSWKLPVPDGNGNMVDLKVEISDQGTYTINVGDDPTTATKGKYTMDGSKMTIQDLEGADCTGVGVYTIKVEGDTMTMTKVSDACTDRSGPEGVMVLKKA
ncbi:hypothetical protein [Haliscomenobacter sp.]|uniref:hypothetical protein n=1 Tax=Haliscomenobacter sp. TaxID=2717303 RepID=UPI003593092E